MIIINIIILFFIIQEIIKFIQLDRLFIPQSLLKNFYINIVIEKLISLIDDFYIFLYIILYYE